MATVITISGNTLRTPDGTIDNCWEDRASGLLSRAAGLALMPHINADERQYSAYEREYERVERSYEYGDPDAPFPPSPEPLHTYMVDGEIAFVSKGVRRDEACGIWMNDGEPTGRVYVSTLSETMDL